MKYGSSVLENSNYIIVNLSISESQVPDEMKLESVKPLYKWNSALKVNNYRPVKILSSRFLKSSFNLKPFWSKITYYKHQSGFRKCYSTDKIKN